MYYIVSKTDDGKEVLLGPKQSKYRAEEFADEMTAETEVISFPTRNLARATQMYKAKRLENMPDKDVNKVPRRVAHQFEKRSMQEVL